MEINHLFSDASKSLLKLGVLACQILNLLQHGAKTCCQPCYKLIGVSIVRIVRRSHGRRLGQGYGDSRRLMMNYLDDYLAA